MSATEISSTLVIAWCRTSEHARSFIASLPKAFSDHGELTIGDETDQQLHPILWTCRHLPEALYLIKTPYEVITPDDLADGKHR